jgi:exosortase J
MAENLEIASPAGAADLTGAGSLPVPRARIFLVCGIAILTLAGCVGIYRDLAILWLLWRSDPLRSIGMLIPPVSIALTLLVWRRLGWQMQGTWWGLAVIALSYVLSLLRDKMMLVGVAGQVSIAIIPVSLPVFVYGCGIILLFAGAGVARRAWFPLGLLLLVQPVPILANGLIDIPLQNISAHVARSFAIFIHFAPTTPELRLMFSPDFGMFIAPGCDGIRGAVTMGYMALILAYVKRFVWYLWATFVVGAVLLGYVFNFIRLCALVVYYRIALGHPALEGVAKQADYVIGSCLFLIATLLFLWLASRKQRAGAERAAEMRSAPAIRLHGIWLKCAAFAALAAAALALPTSALTFARAGGFNPESYAARMPSSIGNFAQERTWYEQQSGSPVVEASAYSMPGSDEVILGVWISPLMHIHDPASCWLARGLEPEKLTILPYRVADGETLNLSTGFYSDGVTDSIVLNATCTAQSCSQFQNGSPGHRFGILYLGGRFDTLAGSGHHPVSIMVRIDRLHSEGSRAETQQSLTDEAQRFLAGFDPESLSRAFQ